MTTSFVKWAYVRFYSNDTSDLSALRKTKKEAEMWRKAELELGDCALASKVQRVNVEIDV